MTYCTLTLSAGQDEISLEERESIRRHLCHLSTDIFGDDQADLDELATEFAANGDNSAAEDPADSVFHTIRHADRKR